MAIVAPLGIHFIYVNILGEGWRVDLAIFRERALRFWQHSSGNVPCDSCTVIRWLPGLGSSPGINNTIWYRRSRSVYLAGMRPVFQWLVGALSKTRAVARVSGYRIGQIPYSHFGISTCRGLWYSPSVDVSMRERVLGRERGAHRRQHRP